MCRLTLAGFSSFSSGHLKDTVDVSIGPRYIYRPLLTLLMDEGLALLHSNLSIHPDERGVARTAFTEILRFGSVWHSTHFGDNGLCQLASLIADTVDSARCGASVPSVLFLHASFGKQVLRKGQSVRQIHTSR
jgi:hypothetical protein